MMPSHIREMFDGIAQDVWHLNIKAKFYFQLFHRSHLQNELLKRAAGLLFNHLDHSLFSDILLNIARLNDPSKTGKHNNWTVQALKDLVEADAELLGNKLDLSVEYRVIDNCRDYFKNIRDRFLAHRDWDRREDPVPNVVKPHLEIMMSGYGNFLNAIEHHYTQTTTSYDQIETQIQGDGDSLVRCLVEWAKASGEEVPEFAPSWDHVF